MSVPVTSSAVPWERIRARVRLGPQLYRPLASGAGQHGPRPPAYCVVCRGPAGDRFARCYQCARHEDLGRGLVADAVVPVSYAVRGTAYACDLWGYKSWRPDDPVRGSAGSATVSLLALLLVFLNDHGDCVWRAAGMPVPDRLAVVPSGYGRPGPHPLLRLVAPYIRLPRTRLVVRPGEQGRDLNVRRFVADDSAAGANVLMLDDTWVSGASVQSAAAALKLAGAARVAAVVLGRHLNPADRFAAPLLAALGAGLYDPARCAVHRVPSSEPQNV
jgi:hypothetical protein